MVDGERKWWGIQTVFEVGLQPIWHSTSTRKKKTGGAMLHKERETDCNPSPDLTHVLRNTLSNNNKNVAAYAHADRCS